MIDLAICLDSNIREGAPTDRSNQDSKLIRNHDREASSLKLTTLELTRLQLCIEVFELKYRTILTLLAMISCYSANQN